MAAVQGVMVNTTPVDIADSGQLNLGAGQYLLQNTSRLGPTEIYVTQDTAASSAPTESSHRFVLDNNGWLIVNLVSNEKLWVSSNRAGARLSLNVYPVV